jgi:DNA-binding LacI/PurR family transcriptional regulator
MVTQEEVAKKAGVSFITVSRVLNNKTNVKKETREKVLQIIEEMNYHPNFISQALRKSNVKTIGIIIPEPPDVPVHGMEYYNLLLQGIDRSSNDHGYDILISTCRNKDQKVDYLRLFYQRKVDGLILFIPDMNLLKIEKILKNKIPCVIVCERPAGNEVNFIDAENYEGMFRMTEYIIKKGIKNIAFIKGKPFMQNSIDRFNGFCKAMEKHNLPVNNDFVFNGDFTRKGGKDAMEKLVSMKTIPEAILCSNDLTAFGVLSVAKKFGINIPGDMSIIGFDDISISELIDPPLSTIRQPLFEMGKAAFDILYKNIIHPELPPQKKIFPVELIIRKSTRE